MFKGFAVKVGFVIAAGFKGLLGMVPPQTFSKERQLPSLGFHCRGMMTGGH